MSLGSAPLQKKKKHFDCDICPWNSLHVSVAYQHIFLFLGKSISCQYCFSSAQNVCSKTFCQPLQVGHPFASNFSLVLVKYYTVLPFCKLWSKKEVDYFSFFLILITVIISAKCLPNLIRIDLFLEQFSILSPVNEQIYCLSRGIYHLACNTDIQNIDRPMIYGILKCLR